VLSVVALAMVPTFAAAAAGPFGAEVFGSFNTFAMGDVNDAIDAENTAFGTNFDDVSSGISGGLGLRMWANQNWMLSARWEPLFVETESDAVGATGKQNLDANSFQFTGTYFFPSKNPTAKYGIGAGVGMYSIGGEVTDDAGNTADVEGSGPGFHFMGVGEWTMSPGFAFTGSAGYRVASVEIDNTSPTVNADYSGFMARAGLAFYLPSQHK
jgi:hypothetical protein